MIADEVLERQIVQIAAAGGIQRIVEAMIEHKTDGRLQRSACSTLYNLAESVDNRIKIREAGGIESIVEARHMGSKWVSSPPPPPKSLLVYPCTKAFVAMKKGLSVHIQ